MTEPERINQARRGDQAAFNELAEWYYPRLQRHLAIMLHDADLADDMAQEALIAAYLQLHRYRDQYRFSTWLYRIATNKALDHLKKRHAFSLDQAFELAAGTDLQAEVIDRENEQLRDTQVASLREAIVHLPPPYQAVVSLYYWNDQTYPEIALILGRPVGTIRTWLHRAKAQLRKELT